MKPTPDRGSIVIREAQVRAFQREALRAFEDSMLQHLRRHFPAECEAAGEDALREDIRHGVERARAHGFVAKNHVCRYIDVMLHLGRDFDTDPALPWAAAILSTGAGISERLKLRLLIDRTEAHLAERDRSAAPAGRPGRGA